MHIPSAKCYAQAPFDFIIFTNMSQTPALDSNKEHDYHPLPDSESASPSGFSRRLNKYALAGAILASTNSVLLGYDIGVMSGAALFIREDMNITSTQVEILVGSLNVCSLIGSIASGKTSDCIGRRYTIVLAAATFLIGALLMGLAPSFPFLIAGRVVAGIGVGYSLMIAPVYVAELSPAMTRGFLTSLPEVFINGGILLGYISNYALSGLPQNLNWRLMLGLAAFRAIAVAVGVLAMPESPRWLVMKGRLDEAKRVLIRTSESKEEAELRLNEIARAANSLPATSSGNWSGQGVWRDLLLRPTRPIRRILIAAVGVNFFMQASGNDAVVYYSPEVFRDAGIHNKKQLVGVTILMGIAKTFFVLISALFLDSYGRRPLLLLGSIGMAVSLAALGLGSKFLEYSIDKPTWAIGLCVVAVCSAASFFSIGLGPITWVYSSEIFPMRLRAQGSSLAIGVNRLVSGLVAPDITTLIILNTMCRYFSTLEKELESYDCVLFEMVTSRESLENRRNLIATKRLKVKSSRSRSFNILGCIQRQMARFLALDFQLDCMDYESEKWYHADLDFETFKLLQDEKGESFFTFARDMTVRSTKAMMQPEIPEYLDPWRSKLLWASRVLPMPLVGLLIIGGVCADTGSQPSEFPELEALSRLDFGAAMKVFLAKRLTSEFTQATADVEESSVIIGERNRAAMDALTKAIDDGHNRIAILYGGGHMPDLGRRLQELDLIPSRAQWITAWSIRKRNLNSNSLPFLKTMAEVSGWPLNRYQTLALLIFSSVLAIDLWFWELFFGTAVNWFSEVASQVTQYVDNVQI